MHALAAVVVAHGLLGPQVGPRNLATVTTSIHWRGLLILGLLIAGNVFCGACPMVLARDSGLDPLSIKGSYAGAVGLPQFMPSSYRKYAVDYDGDGVIDLLRSRPMRSAASRAT